MKVLLISNDAGGYAHHVEAPKNTTVQQMFERRVGTFHAESYLIRVNRQPAAADQALRDGDRVSFTPFKNRRRGLISVFISRSIWLACNALAISTGLLLEPNK